MEMEAARISETSVIWTLERQVFKMGVKWLELAEVIVQWLVLKLQALNSPIILPEI
jgi:hypothetical protein